MLVQDMVKYLRLNLSIQDSTASAVADPELLDMTDEDLLLYLNIALTKEFPNIESLDYVENGGVYPLILVAKKELFTALAVKYANWYDISADDASLRREQRFNHYMQLVESANKEYKEFNDSGGAGGSNNTLMSYDVLLSNRFYTQSYYDKGVPPALFLYVDNVSSTAVELHWSTSGVHKFFKYKIYLSTEAIYDAYAQKDTAIAESAELLLEITDAKQTTCRITDLLPGTLYHVMVTVTDLSSLSGRREVTFTTEAGV